VNILARPDLPPLGVRRVSLGGALAGAAAQRLLGQLLADGDFRAAGEASATNR
jgi:hypothetical protein